MEEAKMSEFKKEVWNEQLHSVTDISHQNTRVIKEIFRIKKWFKPLHNYNKQKFKQNGHSLH